jgi:hypothetical protein
MMTVEIKQVGSDVWEQRVVTAAPATIAFDYIIDFARHVEWERELLRVQPLNAQKGEYLKTYGTQPTGLVGRIFSRGLRVTCKLKEINRPQRIVWKQYRSHDASGPSSFQIVDFLITPSQQGSLIVVTRRFQGLEGITADVVTGFLSRLGPAFPGLRPDAVQQVLEGHPSRGPGPASLDCLKAILDGARGEARV